MSLSDNEIPNGEILYRYAKPNLFPQDQEEIPVGIFNDLELSCDWADIQKHPEKSFHIEQGRNVIVEIKVCDEIKNPTNPKRIGEQVPDWKQEIIHDPITAEKGDANGENLSHSLVKGKKKGGVTQAIRDNSKIRDRKPIDDYYKSDE